MWTPEAGPATLAALTALGPAYVLILAAAGRRERHPPAVVPEGLLPPVDVIVATHDEAALVEEKVRELAALDYPRERVRFWIADGLSTDGTAGLAEAAAAGDPRFTVLRVDAADKIRQVNAALACARASWVFVTDADARCAPRTLRALVEGALADTGTAVVGAEVRPAAAHLLERVHWEVANALRRRESRLGAASMVMAPAYLFRRSLLESLPADVLADDIHVALAGAAAGGRVRIIDATVTELRAPLDVGSLARHKMRKTDGYLREVFRFLPRVGGMHAWARLVFLWRSAHVLLFPLLLVAAAVVATKWIGGTADGATWAAGVLGGGVLAACVLLGPRRGLRAAATLPALVALLAVVILAAAVRYPLRLHTARYPKVGPADYLAGPNR